MNSPDYYYSTKRDFDGWIIVVLCSAHTGDVKDVISHHRNAHNARQRADKLNRETLDRYTELEN